MSRILKSILLLTTIALLIAGCGKDEKKNKNKVDSSLPPRLQDIQRSGKLVVGTALTTPFEYHDPNTNDLIGFDVDLTKQIADRLHVQIEWKEMAFADLLNELSAGKVDMVIAAMYMKPEREEIIDFTQPYLDAGLVMVVQANDTSITDFNSLNGKVVGVKQGSTGEAWADKLRNEQGINLEVRRYENTVDSLDELNNGLVDVVFNDRNNSLVYIQTHPNVRVQGDIFDPAQLGIAVKTGDSDLLNFINTALTDLKQSGEIDRLFTKWINPEK